MKRITRREFMGNSTKAVATTALIAGFEPVFRYFRPKQAVSPNDQIHVALIGSGGMGKANLTSFLRVPEVECLAVADVDEKHLEDGLKLAEEMRGKRPEGYKDFRQIIDRKDIDAVIVATPDHWHALPTIYAC